MGARAAAVCLSLLAFAALALSTPAFAQAQQAPSIIRPSSTLGPPSGRNGAVRSQPPGSTAAPIDNASDTGAGAAGAKPPLAKANRFRSVARDETILFDAPSERAKKIFIAPVGMPVEVLSVLRNWVKIRDSVGDLAWVERDSLSDRRMVISLGLTPVQREPSGSAGSLFDVDGGVVLELLDDRPVGGYAKVRYASGEVGYVQTSQVWGM